MLAGVVPQHPAKVHGLVEVGGVTAGQIDDLAGLAAHVGKFGHRGRRFAFDVLLKGFGWHISDADGGLALPLGDASTRGRFVLGKDGSVPIHMLIVAPPVELLKQFPATANGAGLNAVSVFAQRVVVGLLGVGST